MRKMNTKVAGFFCFQAIIFLSAFLLFQIELIIAKMFLPHFGGSYLVWGACVVFFQGMLLAGYAYAHYITGKTRIWKYRYWHLLLVAVPLCFFPGRHLPAIHASPHIPMVLDIFFQLSLGIGMVFFVLSTTSVIFQRWIVASPLPQRANPYALYATSNLGSFIGLLSYPFYFERVFDLSSQLVMWRAGYVILVVLHLAALRLVPISPAQSSADATPAPLWTDKKVSKKAAWMWLLLSAATSIMFLSVTNTITYEIAPLPLFWILPLSIYLVTFVLNFKRNPWCPAWIRNNPHLIIGFAVLIFFLMRPRYFPFAIVTVVHMAMLFIVCMACHYKLNASKPSAAEGLTLFYLMIATGGFLGSMFITWIVPLVAKTVIEYLLGLFLMALALRLEDASRGSTLRAVALSMCIIGILAVWPASFKTYNIFGLAIIASLFYLVFARFKKYQHALSISLGMLVVAHPFIHPLWQEKHTLYTQRNYYGIYRVYDEIEKRYLVHGNTRHGAQFLPEQRQMEPLSYYHRDTPIAGILTSPLFHFSRIGVIGLGTGALTAYAQPGQTMDFFEIDKSMFTIASRFFTYLKKSKGSKNYIFGDARLMLDEVPLQYYDILIIDAFSGDAIPTHLLTTEAIEKYRSHLAPPGVLVFHVSNRYLELRPVLFRNAHEVGAYARTLSNKQSLGSLDASTSIWVALSWDKETMEKIASGLHWTDFSLDKRWSNVRPWTDGYSNFLPILNLSMFLSQIQDFRPFSWNSLALTEDKKMELYYLEEGDQLAAARDYAEALDYYGKALRINPKNDEAYLAAGKIFLNQGSYNKAAGCFYKVIELKPDIAAAYWYLGRMYSVIEKHAEAISFYKKALQFNDDSSAKYYYYLALSYAALGQYKESIDAFQNAISDEPQEGYQSILYNFLLAPKPKVAEDLVATAIHSNEDQDDLDLGESHASLGQFYHAIEHYNRALKDDNHEPELYKYLGIAYFVVGERERSLENLNKAKQLFQAAGDIRGRDSIEELMRDCFH